eukprot:COSAG06_NODE_69477_length_197_cov_64.193878_1_plen_23_part_01
MRFCRGVRTTTAQVGCVLAAVLY